MPFQDPENVGAVIRSAAAFGAARVVLLARGGPPVPSAGQPGGRAGAFSGPLQTGPALADLRVENAAPLIALDMTGARSRGNAISRAVRAGRGRGGAGASRGASGRASGDGSRSRRASSHSTPPPPPRSRSTPGPGSVHNRENLDHAIPASRGRQRKPCVECGRLT